MNKKPKFLKNSTSSLSLIEDDRPAVVGLIQQMSPELISSDPKYIPDASPGMLFNNLTRDVFKEIEVLVVGSKTTWVEWIPRERGGGFVASYPTAKEAQMGADPTNDLQKGVDFFCLTPEGAKVVVPFYKSKLKTASRWSSLILREGDTHAAFWKIGSVTEKSQKGSYFNYKVDFSRWVDEESYNNATALAEASANALLEERTDI